MSWGHSLSLVIGTYKNCHESEKHINFSISFLNYSWYATWKCVQLVLETNVVKGRLCSLGQVTLFLWINFSHIDNALSFVLEIRYPKAHHRPHSAEHPWVWHTVFFHHLIMDWRRGLGYALDMWAWPWEPGDLRAHPAGAVNSRGLRFLSSREWGQAISRAVCHAELDDLWSLS